MTLLDPAYPDTRVEFGLARAEFAARAATVANAEQLAAIFTTLREAREHPEVYVGPTAAAHDRDAVQFAERAAIADLAMRLNVAESTIRSQAMQAASLISRAPRVWQAFRDGDVPTANARIVAELAETLPDEASWSRFEDAVLTRAATLAPARFRTFARATRERIQPDPAERHNAAAQARRVRLDRDIDGMVWFNAYLPATAGERAMARIETAARSLATAPGETRTLEQLKADVAADLLAGVLGVGGASVSVAVTVPVLSLLGHSDAPATLEGYGPIDPQTARELAAHAPSFTRILTHPITGTILDVDRTTYRPPADLRRWVGILGGHLCGFAGCGNRNCDLDHIKAWADGGPTSADNLQPLCRPHHRLKHKAGFRVVQIKGKTYWRSPTGALREVDPPPF